MGYSDAQTNFKPNLSTSSVTFSSLTPSSREAVRVDAFYSK